MSFLAPSRRCALVFTRSALKHRHLGSSSLSQPLIISGEWALQEMLSEEMGGERGVGKLGKGCCRTGIAGRPADCKYDQLLVEA